MTDVREAPPLYICPEFRRAIDNLFFSLENPQYFSSEFPALKRYLFFGQQKLQKEAQLLQLIESKQQDAPINELIIDVDQSVTLERLNEFTVTPDTIIVVRNVHFLVYALKHPTIQKFAHNLHTLQNVIIGISDIPVDPDNMFYRQFEEFVVATTPTLEHLQGTFQYYFEHFQRLIEQNSHNINLKIDAEDYKWLSQQSTHCHDVDVQQFMQRIYRHAVEQIRLKADPVEMDRAVLENPDNGFMYSMDRDGTLSITQREVTQEQNVFTSMAQMGVRPRKRARE